MSRHQTSPGIAIFIAVLTITSVTAAPPVPLVFTTPITGEILDADVFAEWIAGVETRIDETQCQRGPRDVLWTQNEKPDWRGVSFGRQSTAGTRHLRIAWKQPIAIGSVLVRGGGVLSVLKPDAVYPGDLDDEDQWIPAERSTITSDATQVVTSHEVERDEYGFWVLPPMTKTQAIRFTHVASTTDRESSGYLGNAWVLSDRVANVAPQGTAVARHHSESADRVINGTNDGMWKTWASAENNTKTGDIVSSENPQWIVLAWRQPVQLSGVALLWAGFAAADWQVLKPDVSGSPLSAPESGWQTVGSVSELNEHYPMPLCPIWMNADHDSGQPVTTRAIRLRMTAPSLSTHEHLRTHIAGGRRVWLGELAAITRLGDTPLASVIQPPAESDHAPIPIRFKLNKPGLMTLVIDDQQGQRVRNLIGETPFDAGEHVVWWDASDDVSRDLDSPRHGLYHIPTRLVPPGTYQVRGLLRDPLKLIYEMSVYSSGKPVWETADGTGCWMTNHTPPTSVAFVPGERTADGSPLMFMGAYVSEGGHGLQWVRLDGSKVGGQGHVGGHWTGAPTLAVDHAPSHLADDLCYVASVWEGELRITAKTKTFGDREIFKQQMGDDPRPDRSLESERPVVLEGFDGGDRKFVLAGLAVHDGVIVLSFPRQNELRILRVDGSRPESKSSIDNPRGVAFDRAGRLHVLSGTRVLRATHWDGDAPTEFEDIGIESLQDPRQMVIDEAGRFFISDRGDSHQVKIFAANGSLLGQIGNPGAPAVGPYDPLHLNTPNGIAIDSRGHLWVAECDFRPKRVSVWDPRLDSTYEAKLVNAFYGPTEYGGGGVLDPLDKSKFYYKGMEFELDWQTGTNRLVRVFDRPREWLRSHYGSWSPDTPLYPRRVAMSANAASRTRYFTSCYTTNPTNGDRVAFVWMDQPDRARIVAGLGSANEWSLLKTDEFRGCWPAGMDPNVNREQNAAFFCWSDANGDGTPQANEVEIRASVSGGVTIDDALTATVARLNGKAVCFAATVDPETFIPRYLIDEPSVLLDGAQGPASSGGDQALATEQYAIFTNAPQPFSNHGIGGVANNDGTGEIAATWSYPSLWPGLHASHEAAVPDRPGMIVGHTRLLGGFVQPSKQVGPMFAVNGNMGNVYLMTADGLFVATLFHDIRLRDKWSMPRAVRGMDVSDVSLHDENFWPSITQTSDGKVYLVDGANSSIVRVDGLDSIRRFPPMKIQLTANDLDRARQWMVAREQARQAEALALPLAVSMRDDAPVVDGDLSDWPSSDGWAIIDRRGVAANFNSNSKPYDVSAAVKVADGKLFVAYRTSEKDLLRNSGETPNALFKTGGCLDLMLATQPEVNVTTTRDVQEGDVRVLVTHVDGKTRATLYRAVVPGTAEGVKFSSPWRTIEMDEVRDISEQTQLADNGSGNFEISVPLETLGWQPQPGQTFRGDVGILRGNGRETTQRVYWSNKATAITSDVPSEAQLSPSLWGTWVVE